MKARNNFLKKGMMSLALSLCVIATPMSGMSMVASAASEDALYTQDFTDVTDASTVATSTNAQSGLTIETDSTHGNYLSFNLATSGESSSRGGYLNFTNLDVSTRDTYIVEFDASISQTNSQSSSLAVKCTDAVYDSKNVNYGIASGYLIELNCSGSYSNTYTLNDTETVTIPGSVWCHYKLYVNKTLGLVSTTITYDETDSSGAVTTKYAADRVHVAYNGAGNVNGLYLKVGRYNGIELIDNIEVRPATESDDFGEVAAETFSRAEFTEQIDAVIAYPAEGATTSKAITVKAVGNLEGDLTESATVEWSVAGVADGEQYITLTKAADSTEAPDGATAYLNVADGAATTWGYVKAVVTCGEGSQTLMTPFAVISDTTPVENRLAPAVGYPVSMDDYSNEVVGYTGNAFDIKGREVLLNNWNITGSNGARSMTLVEEDGKKALKFASNNGSGSTVGVYQWTDQDGKYVIDFTAKFPAAMGFGVYANTPNNGGSNAEWAASFDGSALTLNGNTDNKVEGISTSAWYRYVVTADIETQKVSIAVYDSADVMIGEIADVDMTNDESKQIYFCFMGTWPMYLNSFEAYTVEPEAEITGYSVGLGSTINLNFHMNFSDAVTSAEEASVIFSINGESAGSYDITSDWLQEDTYVFPCYVAAKQMTDTIDVAVSVDGATTEVGSYSVRDYAIDLMKMDGTTEDTINLVKAMLNYGAYAQQYLDYKDGDDGNEADLANADYETELTISAENMAKLAGYVPIVDEEGNTSGITYEGSTLLLETSVNVRHYFTADGVEFPDTLNENEDGTYGYYESAGLMVSAWGDMEEFAPATGCSVEYSPLSYVATVLGNTNTELTGDTELKNLMKAMYLYYLEAVN